MPQYKVAPKKPEIVPQAQLTRLKAESTRLVPDIVARAQDVIITCPEDYALVDADLTLLTRAERGIELKFRGTAVEPGPISTIRKGLDQLYALERELLNPLKQAREIVTRKMKDFQVIEQRKIQAAREEQEREAAKVRAEAERLEKLAATTKSQAVRTRLEDKAATIRDKAEEVAADVPQATQVVGSSSRMALKVKVNDIKKLAKGIACGLIPIDVVIVAQGSLNGHLRADEESVRAWAEYGVEVYSDAVIVRH